ncbi:MAG: hypothetical protein KGJ23_03145 [Euryarchaeota archaeon]|nr:hypothetical protein [Euryarchaeota archaeon]MDE1835594.1 hypothetical protein [Euryarchaeota archaeon]MDE1878942.1 hypothetical protein [Euryarchaeota archaeon]MDE2043784.1 hypothetical protein [Thermoplasmata archaeon]
MQARRRLLLYLALWVASLVVLPLLLPPARDPTYGPPPVLGTATWTYVADSTYEGSVLPNGGTVALNLALTGAHDTPVLERWNWSARGPVASTWPFAGWVLDGVNGYLEGIAWQCPNGTSWANLSRPVPGGLSFPLGAGGVWSTTVSAVVGGACSSAIASTFAQVNATYQRLYPPGSSTSCVLYVCNSYRQYATTLSVVLRTLSSGPLAAWTLQGLYDPSISGYRALEATSRAPTASEPVTANLSVADVPGVSTPSSPSPATEFLDSAVLVLLVPAAALLFEVLAFRRATQRAELATERAVLSALSPEEAEAVPPGEVYDSTVDESVARPPG